MSQLGPETNSESELLQPSVRKWIRTFGVIISAYVFGVFLVYGGISLLLGALFIGVGLLSLFICTERGRLYYTPLIITGFYLFGYMLSFAQVLLNKDDVQRVGFGAIGDFMFTDSQFFVVVLVVAMGIAGMLAAMLIAEKLARKQRSISILKTLGFSSVQDRQLYVWIWAWGALSVCLALLMWSLEIGRTGLAGTRLPFRLAGFFVYLKMIFVPFGGIFLLDICLRGAKKMPAILVLTLLVVIGIVGSLGATSRGAFAFTVFPAILYLLFTSRKKNLSQKLFYMFSTIALAVATVVAFVVDIVRGFVFAKVSWDLSSSVSLLKNISSDDFDFFEMIQILISLATGRVGGVRELMAVVGSNVADLGAPFKMFIGTMSEEGHAAVTGTVMGFIPYADDTVGFGITFGMWGQLFLSKSFLVVFLGTIILVSVILVFEEVFVRKGLYSVALLLSILLSFQFWGSASMFILSRFTAVSLICYATVLYVNRQKGRHE